jgi:peptidoglycan/xylan/chitin deacetylase (PgdA/CDA1 family)
MPKNLILIYDNLNFMKKFLKMSVMLFSHLLIVNSALSQTKSDYDSSQYKNFIYSHGGIIRGDSAKKEIALVFTGDSYADGADHIIKVLKEENVKASFFFTGNFYRNKNFKNVIKILKTDNHYLGAHSDNHLLYCVWEKRDSTLITNEEFREDMLNNYKEMEKFGVSVNDAKYFLPPYEWYNNAISKWTEDLGLILINFTPGTKSNADYTTPDMANYISSGEIHKSILEYESSNKNGLNGFILLIHLGTAPERIDKYYFYLEDLIKELKKKNYSFKRINELLR